MIRPEELRTTHAVIGIKEEDARVVRRGLFRGEPGPGSNDYFVAGMDQAGSGAIDHNRAGTGRSGDGIGFETGAVGDVPDMHAFVDGNTRGFEQACVNGDGPFIVNIGVSDCGSVQFSGEEFSHTNRDTLQFGRSRRA